MAEAAQGAISGLPLGQGELLLLVSFFMAGALFHSPLNNVPMFLVKTFFTPNICDASCAGS